MIVTINDENRTLMFAGEYTVAEMLNFLDRTPDIEDFTIIPQVEIVEKIIYKDSPFQPNLQPSVNPFYPNTVIFGEPNEFALQNNNALPSLTSEPFTYTMSNDETTRGYTAIADSSSD